ncbi:MAG TPA: hypothetical protein VMV59_07040 [Candidatus Dormibacteraeota bacterium]|nr:hypothetical protein [Candidatus Dormibacteraeota bacterium]
MSHGPWSSSTRERHGLEPPKPSKLRPIYIDNVLPWKNTRIEARAVAKAATDDVAARAIAAMAKRSRRDAKERGVSRFIGEPCENHRSGERYTADDKCVLCKSEFDAARRGAPPPHNLRRASSRTYLPHSYSHGGSSGGARTPPSLPGDGEMLDPKFDT